MASTADCKALLDTDPSVLAHPHGMGPWVRLSKRNAGDGVERLFGNRAQTCFVRVLETDQGLTVSRVADDLASLSAQASAPTKSLFERFPPTAAERNQLRGAGERFTGRIVAGEIYPDRALVSFYCGFEVASDGETTSYDQESQATAKMVQWLFRDRIGTLRVNAAESVHELDIQPGETADDVIALIRARLTEAGVIIESDEEDMQYGAPGMGRTWGAPMVTTASSFAHRQETDPQKIHEARQAMRAWLDGQDEEPQYDGIELAFANEMLFAVFPFGLIPGNQGMDDLALACGPHPRYVVMVPKSFWAAEQCVPDFALPIESLLPVALAESGNDSGDWMMWGYDTEQGLIDALLHAGFEWSPEIYDAFKDNFDPNGGHAGPGGDGPSTSPSPTGGFAPPGASVPAWSTLSQSGALLGQLQSSVLTPLQTFVWVFPPATPDALDAALRQALDGAAQQLRAKVYEVVPGSPAELEWRAINGQETPWQVYAVANGQVQSPNDPKGLSFYLQEVLRAVAMHAPASGRSGPRI